MQVYGMNVEGLILVVEDDENDVILLEDAFRRAGIHNPVKIAENGDEAVDYLSGSGPFVNRYDYPLPIVIFTDISMPFMGGVELVRWIKGQPGLSEIPVIGMTGTETGEIREEAYRAGANLVFSKPNEHRDLVEQVKHIREQLLVA